MTKPSAYLPELISRSRTAHLRGYLYELNYDGYESAASIFDEQFTKPQQMTRGVYEAVLDMLTERQREALLLSWKLSEFKHRVTYPTRGAPSASSRGRGTAGMGRRAVKQSAAAQDEIEQPTYSDVLDAYVSAHVSTQRRRQNAPRGKTAACDARAAQYKKAAAALIDEAKLLNSAIHRELMKGENSEYVVKLLKAGMSENLRIGKLLKGIGNRSYDTVHRAIAKLLEERKQKQKRG